MSASRPAADEFGFIHKRLDEIRAAEQLHCPNSASKLLHACLREASRCPVACPYYHDWIGPQP